MAATSLDSDITLPRARSRKRRSMLPFVGSVGLILLAIVAASLIDRTPPKPVAYAMILYGGALTFAITGLGWAAQRGRVAFHLAAIVAIVFVGIMLPGWVNPSRYSVNTSGFPLIGTLLDQLFLHFKQLLVDPFGGLLGNVDTAFWEALNGLALSVWTCLVALGSLFARRARKVEAGSERAAAYHWPTLNNPTVARTLGFVAILMTAAMLLWGGLNATQDARTQWTVLATGFPWFAIVAAVYHLSMLAQRQLAPPVAVTAEEGVTDEDEVPSVRPLFEALRSTFAARLAFDEDGRRRRGSQRQAGASPSSDAAAADFKDALALLSSGGQVVQSGTADREFYRLFSEAVQQAQDQGRNTLVICPNGAGEEVADALSRVTRFFSPEINQRWCLLTRVNHTFSGRRLYDLILAEEDQFHDVLVPNKEEFHHSLRRTRLIVLIDFHAIDACRFYLSLTRLEDLLDLQQESVLCLSRSRIGFEGQLRTLFDRGGETGQLRRFAAAPNPQPVYRLAWNDSPVLRREFGKARYGFRQPFTYDTGAYLSLVGADDDLPCVAVIDGSINVAGDFERLAQDLRTDGDAASAGRMEHTRRMAHFAPADDARVTIAPDRGNLAELLDCRFDFHRKANDRLVHIVTRPYAAHDFACSWLKDDAETFRTMGLPFTQTPGVGLTELAVRAESALQAEDGLEEAELRKLLSQVSGDLPVDLDLNETRGGLMRLFRAINPDLSQAAVSARTNADQTHVFSLDASSRISVLSQPSTVMQEGGQIPLGQLSPRDEGLTFARNHDIYLDRGAYRLERINEEARQIFVSPVARDAQENGRRSQVLFRRTYTLHLGEGFAREQERHEGPAARLHIHASFTRDSDRDLSWPIDEPLHSKEVNAPIGYVSLSRKRSYRSVNLVALGGSDLRPGEPYSPVVRRTLAASLQDVLSFLFPALAERIAVVDLQGEWGDSEEPAHERLQLRYPIGRIDGGPIEESIRQVFRRVGVGQLANLEDGWCTAALAVIEDADHDIGVARRVHDSWSLLVPIWKRHLDWAAKGEAPWRPEDGWFDPAAAAALPLFAGW